MDQFTRDNFQWIKFKALEFTNGSMVKFIRANGRITVCMVRVIKVGQTEKYTKATF